MLNIFLFAILLHYIVDYISDVGNYKPLYRFIWRILQRERYISV